MLHTLLMPDGAEVDPSAVPPDGSQRTPPPAPYPFELDDFQRAACGAIDAGRSVVVAAPTSAGKTLVAEHAVRAALGAGGRAVYASPLKALSNQKYRELQGQFEDVGLMTGDNNVNCEASCLVMTTEVPTRARARARARARTRTLTLALALSLRWKPVARRST